MNDSQISEISATHSMKDALSYLFFTVFMLVTSVVMMTVLWASNSMIEGSDNRLNFAAIFFLGLVLISGSLLSLRVALQNYFVARQLEREGKLADGIITRQWEDTFECWIMYYVSYRFEEDTEACETISKSVYQKLQEGCKVPIRYLEQEPSVFHLDYDRLSV
jgi:hypothetical protein